MLHFNHPKQYFNIVLDNNFTIVTLESNFRDVEFDSDMYIGKNWFDEFVEINDQSLIRVLYNALLERDTMDQPTCAYDIKSSNGNHLLIDFIHEVVDKNNQKYILLNGVPRY